jgi:predicted AAA+ superfamily ATPase
MDDMILKRIADALDRIAPMAGGAARPKAPALFWHRGSLRAVEGFRPLSIDLLTGIDAQKASVLENSRRLAAGHAAHDILLWGARGSGKSALVKSAFAAVQAENPTLTLVEASCDALETLPDLFQLLAHNDHQYIVFIDDIGFEKTDSQARHLRSVLDGGISQRPSHVRLYVTSNRRHIVPRHLSEQDSAINPRDVVDDALALSDRFGLSLGFHRCDQDAYLAMIEHYAAHLGLNFDADEALTWSTQRGSRSGRVAWQFAVELAGRAGKAI